VDRPADRWAGRHVAEHDEGLAFVIQVVRGPTYHLGNLAGHTAARVFTRG